MRTVYEEDKSEAVVAGEYEECELMQQFSLKNVVSEERKEQQAKSFDTWKRKYRAWEKLNVLKTQKTPNFGEEKVKYEKNFGLYDPSRPPFPGSEVTISSMLDLLAPKEYIDKPYDCEALTELLEMNQRLKSSVMVYSRNSVGLGIDFRPTNQREVAALTPAELEEYKKQGKELIAWYNNRVEQGKNFSQVAYEVMYGKSGLGEGYFEVVDSVKGSIKQIASMSPIYIWETVERDKYIWIKNGRKKYFKRFNDKAARNIDDFGKPTTIEKYATRLLPFREYNLVSDVYGVAAWTGAIPQVIGARYASERNVNLMLNDAPQPLDAKVLTPYGWKIMADVVKGSKISGRDGLAHTVCDVLPQGKQDVYTVTFMDGSQAECTRNHTWTVSNHYDRLQGKTRNKTLGQMMDEGLYHPSGGAKWAVPMNEPIEFAPLESPLPIHPYLLGLLLGNGSFRGDTVKLATFLGDSDEVQAMFPEILPEGVSFHRRDRIPFNNSSEFNFKHGIRDIRRAEWAEYMSTNPTAPIPQRTCAKCGEKFDRDGFWNAPLRKDGLNSFCIECAKVAQRLRLKKQSPCRYNALVAGVQSLGLRDVLGKDKFIPEVYLRASIEERIALLQGLIDSDGCIGDSSNITVLYTTVSRKLAEDIKELVGSLGGLTSISPVKNRTTLQLVIKRLPHHIVPTRLSRKVAKYAPTSVERWRTIKDITFSKTVDTQCLVVDSLDSLYITNDYIVTHNCPRMVIMVAGGAVDDETKNTLKSFFQKGKGRANAGRTLLLCVSSKNALSPNAKPPTVTMEPLTVGKTEDGSFMAYSAGCDETIREAFRIALTFYGTAGDSNRASSYTLRDQTVSMVNKPEAEMMAFLCNDTFTHEWAIENGLRKVNTSGEIVEDKLLAEIYFITPTTMSEKDSKEIHIQELISGALTINNYRSQIGLEEIDKWWADLPRTLAVTALQMAAIAPAIITTMTDRNEFDVSVMATAVSGAAETTLVTSTDETTKALAQIRQALNSVLKHNHVGHDTLGMLDKMFTMVKSANEDDEWLHRRLKVENE